MEIIILDTRRKETFDPDAQRWYDQNPPAQYCLSKIGSVPCFVKRQKALFNGWGLVHRAISEEQIRHTPRVVSLAKHNDYYYYFAERLEGMTLEEKLKTTRFPVSHCEKLIRTLFACIQHINQKGFWYTDLCKKNIFAATTGQYYLIDIDSCFPHSALLKDLTDTRSKSRAVVSNEYSPLLMEFAKTTGGLANFNINLQSGECVNQAELVAIAVDIKQLFTIPIDKKRTVIHGKLKHRLGQEYTQLFSGLIRGRSDWSKTRELVEKIIGTIW